MGNANTEGGGGGTTTEEQLRLPGDPGAFRDVAGKLVAPAEGEARLDHNEEWVAADEAFCAIRDTINEVIDKINDLAAMVGNPLPCLPLAKLPDKTLNDYLVKPLAGDYGKIRQNANACDIMSKGMNAWSDNFLFISLSIPSNKMAGDTADGFRAHCAIYALIIRGFSLLVDKASAVFDAIALASEEISVEIEDVIMALGKILKRLAKVIAKRFSGLFGLAKLGYDVLKDGFGVVTDVVDDITKAIALIENCFELKELAEAWVVVQVDRLKSFEQIVEVVKQLPATGAEIISEQQITPGTRKEIAKIIDLIRQWEVSDEEIALKEKLEELGLISGDENESE